ncbi:MAG: hypothetical protein NT124_01000 [Candidatus Dependentiae bacterium]|nr:hypothetical protein [Candidatus Dependentiae bacterium]
MHGRTAIEGGYHLWCQTPHRERYWCHPCAAGAGLPIKRWSSKQHSNHGRQRENDARRVVI